VWAGKLISDAECLLRRRRTYVPHRQMLPGVEVRAEAYVSLNGGPSQLLLDPTADLAAARDSLLPQPWIVRRVRVLRERPGTQ
jgi:hypothetical protein